MTSLETAELAAKALCERKGVDVKVLQIRDISSIADYFVIATGSSTTHVKSLADNVEYRLDQENIGASHIEGHHSDSWILMDYVDVIVHVFSEEAREYYSLERLWEDGQQVDISAIEQLPLEKLFPNQKA